ncbi:MAG: PilZ domain-containing protein [Deltaproteobacteria bacterium]|nr:PilZ domain-containing protein [Deltaproteobacteria bacterium]
MEQETTDTCRESRRHKRYRACEGALAFLGSVPGTITDISQGGMCVNYVVFGKDPDQVLKLDIFFSEADFYLPGIPGRIVSDVDCSSEAPFSVVQVRRLGIEFGELSSEQEAGLKYFLLHNTISEA